MKKVGLNKIKDLEIHLLFTGFYSLIGNKEIVFEKMKKFRMKRLMVTSMSMSRFRLITKEKRDELYLGRKEMYKGSINDSIETLLGNIRLGNQPNEILNLYFTPRLTDEEMQLIERKDPVYLQTFSNKYPDLDDWSMKNSESDSKFCYTFCQRETKSYQLPDLGNSQSQNDRIPVAPPVPKKIKFN